MTMRGDGFVGIGTTVPSTLLEIEDTAPEFRITDDRTDYGSSTGVTMGAISFFSRDGSMPNDYAPTAKILIESDNGTVAPDGRMLFQTGINGVLTTAMSIDANGNVGIGTATPSTTLHIHRDNASGGDFIHLTNNDTGQVNTDGIRIGMDSSENMYIFQNENASIRFGTNNTEVWQISNGNGNLVNQNGGYVLGKQIICQIGLAGGTGAATNDNSISTSSNTILLLSHVIVNLGGGPPSFSFNRSYTFNNGYNDSTINQVADSTSPSEMEEILIPTTGVYKVHVRVVWPSNSTGYRAIQFVDNGTGFGQIQQEAVTSASTKMENNAIRRFTAGDNVGVSVWQNSGGNLIISEGEFTVELISSNI